MTIESKKMKLHRKKTLLIGLIFFLICAFWQAYDSIVPKILIDKFGLNQTWSGFVMSLDNLLALFLLPLFGSMSDKTKTKFGRRTPYILIGTLVAAVLFVGMTFTDNLQAISLKNIDPSKVTYQQANEVLWTHNPEIANPEYNSWTNKNEAKTKKLQDFFQSKEAFISIGAKTTSESGAEISNPEYTKYVVPARQAYAWTKTVENPLNLVFFVILLLLVLVAMATFRSPAVALMPDITVKPLRSQANALINLTGAAGGIAVIALGTIVGTGKPENALMSYTLYFGIISFIMIVALATFFFTVKEPKLVKEMEEEVLQLDLKEETSSRVINGKLSPAQKKSLFFLLASVVLWFMGYNAVISKYSVYAGTVLAKDFNTTLLIAQAVAIISYIPIGILSSKIGRKKMILIGVFLLTTAFSLACFIRPTSSIWLMNGLFSLAGFSWASINVNSFPMVVDLATENNVGKFTGFYYTASMSAQILTPPLSGFIMDSFGNMHSLFPYATIFVALAFVTMLFVKHGDSLPTAPSHKLEAFSDAN